MRAILEWLFRVRHGRALDMLASVPGGRPPIFLLGNALDLAGRDLHTLFEQWRAERGDLFRFFLFGQPSLVTAKPEHFLRILVERPDDWIKNVPGAATRPVGGQSVFRSRDEGPDWKKKRAAHPFEAKWIDRTYDALVPVIADLVRARLRGHEDRPLDLYEEILRVTFDAFARCVFGETLPPEAFVEHETLLREVGRRGALPVAFSWSPVFWWRRHRWLSRIEARMARGSLGEGATDLVSMLARSGADMRSTQVRDELGNIFAAGMKNAAICASATLFLLARHPDVLAAIERELDGAGGAAIDRTTLLALPHLDRAVSESLRLYPSVAGFMREVRPDRTVELDGIALPPRTQVFLVSWVVHRHPGIWKDPTRFDPDRFLAEPAPGTYFPFGLGNRYCVGRALTILCAKAIVADVISQWTIELDPKATFDTTLVSVLTVPKDGVPATLRAKSKRSE